jgi:hypothetical protein
MELTTTSGWHEDHVLPGEREGDPFADGDAGSIRPNYQVWLRTRSGEFQPQSGMVFTDYCAASKAARELVEIGIAEAEVRSGDWIAATYVWLPERELAALLCGRAR